MREPKYSEFNSLANQTWALERNDEVMYRMVDDLGLPQEVAARFYSYLVDHICLTTERVREFYNKSWT